MANIHRHLRPSRPLWQLFGWGSAATLALGAVALLSQTDSGKARLHLALAHAGAPARAIASIPPRDFSAELEIKRLSAQVADLRRERERLAARVATLEHDIGDMTGSIWQQLEQLTAARAQMLTPPPFAMMPAKAEPPAARVPPPVVAAPATTEPTPAVKSAAPPKVAATAIPPAEPAAADLPPLQPLAAKTTPPQAPAAEPAQQQPASQPAQQEAAPVHSRPVRVAAVAADEAMPPTAKSPYAIDLGGASTLQALRYHWAGLKANYGPLMVGLAPLATTHTKQSSGSVFYRLVAGPLPNEAAAKNLCARLSPLRAGCHPAKFAGVEFLEH